MVAMAYVIVFEFIGDNLKPIAYNAFSCQLLSS